MVKHAKLSEEIPAKDSVLKMREERAAKDREKKAMEHSK